MWNRVLKEFCVAASWKNEEEDSPGTRRNENDWKRKAEIFWETGDQTVLISNFAINSWQYSCESEVEPNNQKANQAMVEFFCENSEE